MNIFKKKQAQPIIRVVADLVHTHCSFLDERGDEIIASADSKKLLTDSERLMLKDMLRQYMMADIVFTLELRYGKKVREEKFALLVVASFKDYLRHTYAMDADEIRDKTDQMLELIVRTHDTYAANKHEDGTVEEIKRFSQASALGLYFNELVDDRQGRDQNEIIFPAFELARVLSKRNMLAEFEKEGPIDLSFEVIAAD